LAARRSRDDFGDDAGGFGDAGEALFEALEGVGELVRVEAEEGEEGGVEVVDAEIPRRAATGRSIWAHLVAMPRLQSSLGEVPW